MVPPPLKISSVAMVGLSAPRLVFAGPGSLLHIGGRNPSEALGYVMVYDAASVGAVTVGATKPQMVLPFNRQATRAVAMHGLGLALGCVLAFADTPTGPGLNPVGGTINVVWGK